MSDVRSHEISEVCSSLGVSSRTLRFYEEKGLISSTRNANGRRMYSDEQLANIRNVLTLRAIGLSVKNIQEYQHTGMPLDSIVRLRKAEIQASVNAKHREIKLLNETLAAIEAGKDIFLPNEDADRVQTENDALAYEYAGYIAQCRPEPIYAHMSKQMKSYLPVESLRCVIQDTVRELGAFSGLGEVTHDPARPNSIFCCLQYERLDLQVQFVFYGNIIHGLWFHYLEKAKQKG